MVTCSPVPTRTTNGRPLRVFPTLAAPIRARMMANQLSEANARLIAAAPDLLAHLQHVVRFFDQINPADVARYRAVIAKATGSEA